MKSEGKDNARQEKSKMKTCFLRRQGAGYTKFSIKTRKSRNSRKTRKSRNPKTRHQKNPPFPQSPKKSKQI